MASCTGEAEATGQEGGLWCGGSGSHTHPRAGLPSCEPGSLTHGADGGVRLQGEVRTATKPSGRPSAAPGGGWLSPLGWCLGSWLPAGLAGEEGGNVLTKGVSVLSAGAIGKKSVSKSGQSHRIRSVGSWLQLSRAPLPGRQGGTQGFRSFQGACLPGVSLSRPWGCRGQTGLSPWWAGPRAHIPEPGARGRGRPGAVAAPSWPYPSPENLGQLHLGPGCPTWK